MAFARFLDASLVFFQCLKNIVGRVESRRHVADDQRDQLTTAGNFRFNSTGGDSLGVFE